MLSDKFFQALRETGKPYHQVAWESGLKPYQIYKITAGIDRPEPNDSRIVALCKYLDIPIHEAFKEGTAI